MRILLIAMIALFALPALAGERGGAGGKAAAAATGGAASAAAASGDTFAVGLPSASGGGLSNSWKCATSTQVNVLGLYAYGWTDESALCVALIKRQLACRNNMAAACRRLTADIVNGKHDAGYEEPIVLSREPECKSDTHGVIPVGCPGGLFGG